MLTLTRQQVEQYLVPDISATTALFGNKYHRRFKRSGKRLHQKLSAHFADTIRPNHGVEFAREENHSALLNLADLLATGQLADINFMILRSAYDTLPGSFPTDVPAVDIAIMHQLHDFMLPRKYQTLGEDIYRILHKAIGRKIKLDHAPSRPVINQIITHMVIVHLIQQIKPGVYRVHVEKTAVSSASTSLIDNLLYDLFLAVTLPKKILDLPGLQGMTSIIMSTAKLFHERVHHDSKSGLIYLMERVRVIQETASKQQKATSELVEDLGWILTISEQLIATTDYIVGNSQTAPLPLLRYLALIAGDILFLKNQSFRHVAILSQQSRTFKEWQNQLDGLANDYFGQILSLCAVEEQRKTFLPKITQMRLVK